MEDQPISSKWLTSLVDGYEFILTNDETADRQYLLESLIGDLRGIVKAAQVA